MDNINTDYCLPCLSYLFIVGSVLKEINDVIDQLCPDNTIVILASPADAEGRVNGENTEGGHVYE